MVSLRPHVSHEKHALCHVWEGEGGGRGKGGEREREGTGEGERREEGRKEGRGRGKGEVREGGGRGEGKRKGREEGRRKEKGYKRGGRICRSVRQPMRYMQVMISSMICSRRLSDWTKCLQSRLVKAGSKCCNFEI